MQYQEQGVQFDWQDIRVMNLYNYALGAWNYARVGSEEHTEVLEKKG